ncbi:MAG TPA: hypothetical protein VMW56_04175, partial [Candidatus Margulisiibacteriota bacterium]|nr:hypothetical protein [Candidatus Margulisiibacteriota bacterium]
LVTAAAQGEHATHAEPWKLDRWARTDSGSAIERLRRGRRRRRSTTRARHGRRQLEWLLG